jgi:hypothetical protein
MFLAVAGFGIGALSGVDFKSIDWQHLNTDQLQRIFNSVNWGPLTSMVNDMKAAVISVQDQAAKLMQDNKFK